MGIEQIRAIKEAAKPKEKVYKIPKTSKKQAAVKSELKKLYPIFLKSKPLCEIRSPECTGKSECIHHTRGRGKDNLMNQSTWMASCTRCNSWVEIHDAKAREMGFKKSKF